MVKNNIYGKVKLIEETRYYDSNKVDIQNWIDSEYDINGNLINKWSYYSHGELMSHDIYKYNQKNKLIEKRAYGSDGKLHQNTIYKYNNTENKIEESYLNDKGELKVRETYKYKKIGNKIEVSCYNSDGKLKRIFINDEKGNKIQDTTHYNDNVSLFGLKTTNEYDMRGNLLITTMIDNKNSILFQYKYKYDDKNNMIEECEYIINDFIRNDSTNFIYEYDFQGNWIKRLCGELIYERKIEYYT